MSTISDAQDIQTDNQNVLVFFAPSFHKQFFAKLFVVGRSVVMSSNPSLDLCVRFSFSKPFSILLSLVDSM